jgi:hypothetical protein
MRRPLLVLVLALTAACAPRQVTVRTAPEPGAGITSARALVEAMHGRYAGKWYRNLTFVQTSHYYDASGQPTRIEEWYEAGVVPGRLRIDIGDRSGGNGQLFRNDSAYVFQNGKLTNARKTRNPLMLLGFDIYALDPSRSMAVLAEEGFDTTRYHRATVDGKVYHVVGAAAGDTASRQFWVENDRLLFWRLIQPAQAAARDQRPSEIRFQKYVPHDGGWVAEEVDFLRGGKRYFFETYADVRVNVELDPGLFDPARWMTARFWR